MFIKVAGVALLLILSIRSVEANPESEWIRIASSKSVIYHAKKGSFETVIDKETGELNAFILIQARDTTEDEITYKVYYTKISTCSRGGGKLLISNLDGSRKNSVDYVLDGQNISSTIGTLLCNLSKK